MKIIGYDSDFGNENYNSRKPKKITEKLPPQHEKIYIRDNGICQLCLRPVHRNDANTDHIIPKSLGGTNALKNKQLTHKWCNSIKGNNATYKSPEYYKKHEKYKYKAYYQKIQ